MNISILVDRYKNKKRYYGLNCNPSTVHNLIAAFERQQNYYETGDSCDNLIANIKATVRAYTRDKDVAVRVFKHFCLFLQENGVAVDIGFFPKCSISNDFERLMFISKYLQNPDNRVNDLEDELWVSTTTIESDMRKLKGTDEAGSIQICGKVFKVADLERRNNRVSFPSTPHPLFLTPNITQVIVTLRGLKQMSEDPLYHSYARLIASDIWEQLSDYAKNRVRVVLTELLPEDYGWYESLEKEKSDDGEHEEWFYSEQRCSVRNDVVLDCIKNQKKFFVEYEEDGKCVFYSNCVYSNGSYDGVSIEVLCNQGRIKLCLDKIRKSAYTAEELL